MDDNLPTVTVVIAARPGQAQIQAVEASRRLDYPPEKVEIIVARGNHPSVQRNAALKSAHGEWIYFLDDDSVPPPENLRLSASYFADPETKMVGGPNLCPPSAPPLEQVFAIVLSSWLAFGPSRARYTPVGAPRASSEKELILCNLVSRKDVLLEHGGFNEALYPNEENALMDEIQKRGGKLMYDPRIWVHRRPRATVASFCRMLRTYGRGRAEQFRLHPTSRSALNFVPPLFCAYLVMLAVLAVCGLVKGWLLLPLGLYVLALLGEGALLVLRPGMEQTTPGFGTRLARTALALPWIFLTHVLYGAGFWRGLFTRLGAADRPPVQVALETVQPLRAK